MFLNSQEKICIRRSRLVLHQLSTGLHGYPNYGIRVMRHVGKINVKTGANVRSGDFGSLSPQVQLDGVPHKLLGLEGIVVLNINSWSAGCTMWSDTIKDGLGPSRYGLGP